MPEQITIEHEDMWEYMDNGIQCGFEDKLRIMYTDPSTGRPCLKYPCRIPQE